MTALEQLSDRYGIARDYLDYRKQPVEIAPRARMLVLAAMGEEPSEAAARRSLARLDREALRPLPRTLLIRSDESLSFTLCVPEDALDVRRQLELVLEDGSRESLRLPGVHSAPVEELADCPVRRYRIEAECDCPEGYHRIELRDGDGELVCDCALLVAPRRCWQPDLLAQGGRIFGITVQLYTVRSARNWGMGDFTDLEALIRQSAAAGAQAVGLNPLHALFPANPLHFSPYSPSNRAFLNVMYIDPERVPGFEACEPARARVASDDFQQRLAALRDAHHVDYQGVADCKLPILEMLYRHFVESGALHSSEAASAFLAFCDERGEALQLHATFDAIHEHFLRQDQQCWGWPVWPEEFRDPRSGAVAVFAQEHADRVRFYRFLQWCAHEQLAAAQAVARDCGMAVGIYLDLAVGVDMNGSEVWANRSAFCLAASAGAPPDELARSGQDWGFPPLDPRGLHASAYQLFVAVLRANMSVCGAVRYDHAVSLLRLWWIPRAGSAADGAYVNYSLEDLLGLLALESQRNRCLVIGEDLGTVPEELTREMLENHLYSYRVLYFEKTPGGMRQPADYPREAVATVTTHDLPTLASWWDGSDIDLRAGLGLLGSDAMVTELRAGRQRDRQQLLDALVAAGCWDGERDAAAISVMTTTLNAAAHRFLASSSAAIMLAQVDDLMEMLSPVNVPGTFDSHRNWQRKLRWPLEGLFQRESVSTICRAMDDARS